MKAKNLSERMAVFIQKGSEKYSGKYSYFSDYSNIDTPIKIKCNACQSIFETTPYRHLCHNVDCSRCLRAEKYKKKLDEKYSGRFTFNFIDYSDERKQITFHCNKCRNNFLKTPLSLLGDGLCRFCPEENHLSKISKNTFLQEVHKNQSHEIEYDYSLIPDYFFKSSEIMIKCLKCQTVFSQLALYHMKGHGCSVCANELSGRKKRKIKTKEEFINQAKIVHPEGNYDYTNSIFIDMYTNIQIYCKKHKKYFNQTPLNHLRGNKCRECGTEIGRKNNIESFEDFCNKANKIHNFKFEYIELIHKKNDRRFIKVKCNKKGHIFLQDASNHLAGDGCPYCGYRISKGENNWLDTYNIPIENRQYLLRLKGGFVLKVDGFDPVTNTVYEYYGDYWHGNPSKHNPNEMNSRAHKTFGELYKHTIEREEKIKKEFLLITIWESDWKIKSCVKHKDQ